MIGAHMHMLSYVLQGGLSSVVLPNIVNGALNTFVVNFCLHGVKIGVDTGFQNPFLALLQQEVLLLIFIPASLRLILHFVDLQVGLALVFYEINLFLGLTLILHKIP